MAEPKGRAGVMGMNRKLQELLLPRKRWGMGKGANPAEKKSCFYTDSDSPLSGIN